MMAVIQYLLYLAILVVLAIPLGAYIKKVMNGEKTILSKVLTPCENLVYKVLRVDREEQMTWKKYAVSVLAFSGIGLVFLFLLQLLQGVLVGGGVIQNLKGAQTVSLVEPIAVSAEGEILEDAVIDTEEGTVTVDGVLVPDAQIVTEQFVPMGPAASQVAIKQTGTNGGGYMGVNSAHPLENPNAFTNLVEMISILLIPAALCFRLSV